ncbi:MAG: ubiquinol-cytochrome c reductase cytochrome c1 subunit [bacterium]|nr:MAG: ubiquinol-cytochrome c reductase cytochrome c1 subunit [bacterium]KAF0148946.1 MAG: ubiquinol-cytochrome c reductase cytochrome c1 subunit [bacterium]KAF0168337.1 MAG: ubiquinol-cytochrome c reductase cytochrome c1 subunit [bacterium]TXT22651.1 MAG: ubiquinol-cytochrome c reductase cytochrome c1 subunit [bacterium]
MKKLLFLLLALPTAVWAAGASVPLDRAPVNPHNQESLQRGASVFVNYCLNCHAASYMRYNRMQDFGLSEALIKENLLFASDKPGETMQVAMRGKDAKEWFGVPPPDLSVITRSRGADWVYTYLRGFYRDNSRPMGWNNKVFDNVGMPHVLHDLQGQMVPVYRVEKSADGVEHKVLDRLELARPGSMTLAEYDALVGDLVNYLAWMGEPAKSQRMHIGVAVLLFLGLFYVVAFYLKKEYWKDVH